MQKLTQNYFPTQKNSWLLNVYTHTHFTEIKFHRTAIYCPGGNVMRTTDLFLTSQIFSKAKHRWAFSVLCKRPASSLQQPNNKGFQTFIFWPSPNIYLIYACIQLHFYLLKQTNREQSRKCWLEASSRKQAFYICTRKLIADKFSCKNNLKVQQELFFVWIFKTHSSFRKTSIHLNSPKHLKCSVNILILEGSGGCCKSKRVIVAFLF